METTTGEKPTSEVLGEISALLDVVDHYSRGLASDSERLDLLRCAVLVSGRCTALTQQLAAEVAATQAAEHEHGTSATTWLAHTTRLTPREAAALLFAGRDLTSYQALTTATLTGDVHPQQARAITRVLGDLAESLPPAVTDHAQQLLIGYAAEFNSSELSRLTRHLLEVLDPQTAEASEAERVERDHQRAVRGRHLSFHHDGHGTTQLRGSLPTIDAELLIRLVEAHAAHQKRALEALDPRQPLPSRSQRRADGLMALVHQHSQRALAPSHGGDRPRVVVHLDYDRLHRRCTDAQLLHPGQLITAAALRQLACDADLLPVVLAGASEPLDVGRTQRLVTPPIRAALETRDRGCAFPGCDRPPVDCQAHHITPWWDGGHTALHNLVLLCPYHHNVIEPSHDPTAARWKIRIHRTGIPEVVPPAYVDPTGRARTHARYRSPAGSGGPARISPD